MLGSGDFLLLILLEAQPCRCFLRGQGAVLFQSLLAGALRASHNERVVEKPIESLLEEKGDLREEESPLLAEAFSRKGFPERLKSWMEDPLQ